MKNKTEIMKSVNGMASKTVMKLKKHSPEILVVAGIAGTVVSAVLACKATTKVAEILDETKGTLDTIHEGMETGAINGQEYTTEDGKKDTVVVYAQTGMKLAKLYAPAIILGTLSITSILASNNILRKRNVALGAAYAAIDKSFKEYRGRVIERFGEQVDTELKYGIKAKKFEEIEVDPETGKEKKVKKTVMVADPNLQSDYAVYFDSKSRNYETNPDYNRRTSRVVPVVELYSHGADRPDARSFALPRQEPCALSGRLPGVAFAYGSDQSRSRSYLWNSR